MADGVYNGMPASELPDLQWRLAGSAEAGVEMARLPDGQIAVRNAADPAGPALIYTKAEIEALIGGAQDGDFDALLRLSPGGTTPRTPHVGAVGPDRKNRDRIRPARTDEDPRYRAPHPRHPRHPRWRADGPLRRQDGLSSGGMTLPRALRWRADEPSEVAADDREFW
jgi:hypothetical protein